MLIISKFHDYYDRAIGMGIDKTVVYKRTLDETHWSESPPIPSYTFPSQRIGRDYWDVKIFCYDVGFCGSWYPFAIASGWAPGGIPRSLAPSAFYDAESLAKFFRDLGIKDAPLSRYARLRDRWRANIHLRLRNAQSRAEYFKRHEEDKLFRKHKCPVILRRRNYYKLNPRLADWQFWKVKDAYAAFQDIFMYISGVLGVNTREIITLRDVDKIHKHGFDKWSFRKPPSK